MSEYEFHTLFIEYMSLSMILLMNLVTVLSGFLIASYLVAHKLDRTMVRIVVGVFTGVMLMMIGQMFLTWMDAAAIAQEIQTFPSDWHFVSKTGATGPMISGIVLCSASLAGYVAALAFFSNQRKRHENDPPEPSSIQQSDSASQ